MLFQHSSIYVASRVVSIAASLFAVFAYTRLLSPQEYGLFALVNTGVNLVFMVMMTWLCLSAARLLHAVTNSKALRSSLLISYLAVLGVIVLIGLPILYATSHSWNSLFILIGLAMLAILGWLELNLHLLIAEPKPFEYGSLNAIRAVAAVTLGVAFAFSGGGALGALVGSALGMLLPTLGLTVRYWKPAQLVPPSKAMLREIAVYGLPLMGSSGLSGLIRSTDRLLIATLAGIQAAGLYAVGFNIANSLITALMAPIGGAGFSLAVRALERAGKAAVMQQLSENIVVLVGIGLPAAVGLILVSQNIVDTLIGVEFRDAAKIVIPVLVCGCFLNSIRSYYLDHAFQLGRRTGLQSAMMLTVAIMGIVVNLILIPRYEVMGAAAAMLITNSFGLLLSFAFGRRAYRMPLPVRDTAKIILATGAMSAAVMGLPHHQGMVWLIVQISIGAVAYLSAALVLNIGDVRREVLRRWQRT